MTPPAPNGALARLRATYPPLPQTRAVLHGGTCGATAAAAVRASVQVALGTTPLVDGACDGACWATPAATVLRPGHRHRFAHLDRDADAIPALAACARGECDHEYAGSGEGGLTVRMGRTDGSLAAALAQGAYAALALALDMPPAGVVETAQLAGDLVRGGPMAALAPSWREVRALPTLPPMLVFYGARDEAGRVVERHLLEGDPHRVIEGALIAARATGVSAVALSVEGGRAFAALTAAADEARAAGIVEGDALGRQAAAVYVLEAEAASDGGPLARRYEQAAAATVLFDTPPPPTALLSVAGAVPRPGVYELPVDGSTQWAGVLALGGASPARVEAVRLGGPGAPAVQRDAFDQVVRWQDVAAGTVFAVAPGTAPDEA